MNANEHQAKAVGRDLPISTKHAIEVSRFISGRYLKASQDLLLQVMEKKVAVPFKRFNMDTGHKKGHVGPGRYPVKAVSHFIKILNLLEANASNKGLDTESLVLRYVVPNKAARPFHFGRQRGIKAKRTHLEIIGEEIERKGKKQEKKVTKEVKDIKNKPVVEQKQQ